jgi:hypothetical protein
MARPIQQEGKERKQERGNRKGREHVVINGLPINLFLNIPLSRSRPAIRRIMGTAKRGRMGIRQGHI